MADSNSYRKGKIITFANQKGGVGKSTLCTLFALYLTKIKHEQLTVVDMDNQKTLSGKRAADKKYDPNLEFSFEVTTSPLGNYRESYNLMKQLKGRAENILIDCPGDLTQEGLIAVLPLSDFIVIPFSYDAATLESTSIFVNFVNSIAAEAGIRKPHLFFVCNNYMPKWNNNKEFRMHDSVDKALSQLGTVMPIINASADMKRYVTFNFIGKQLNFVEKSFDNLYSEIFEK